VLDAGYQPDIIEPVAAAPAPAGRYTDQQMKEHVDFIYKIATDIRKVIQKISV